MPKKSATERSFGSKVVYALIYLPMQAANTLYSFSTGFSSRAVFLSVEENIPELLELEKNFDVIKAELEGVLPETEHVPTYHELDDLQAPISGSDKPGENWKVFLFDAMGLKHEENRTKCPQTAALLDKIPRVTQAFFSILEGGKSVPAHEGPYRGYIRYHLALKVPQDNPPRLRVKDQWVTWKEGEGFLFDDTWEHEVENKSNEIRVVLIVDLLRKMRPFASLVNRCVFYALKLVYAKKMIAKA